MRDPDDLFAALSKSAFRRRFRLGPKERRYLEERGLDAVLAHAHDFITQRLAPAHPANDGKQTPMRGHPAFLAQHATATCCRGCLQKWHHIPQGRALTDVEVHYITHTVIRRWLESQRPTEQPRLF
jgi:hypothetical protein